MKDQKSRLKQWDGEKNKKGCNDLWEDGFSFPS